MDEPAQVRAYADADFADVNQAFVDRFRAKLPTLTRGRVLDLGCGPADIPIRLVRALLALGVPALDASSAMLEEARKAVTRAGLDHAVTLVCAQLPNLPFADSSFDAIVSNSLLHHLPDPNIFWRAALRMVRPGAGLLVTDLLRPNSLEAATALVDRYAANEHDLLRRDFHRSLLASYTLDEVRTQLEALNPPSLACAAVTDRHWAVWGHT